MNKKITLKLAIFGRGGAVVNHNGYGFQFTDIKLIKNLSKRFSKIYYMPPTLNTKDPRWQYFRKIYSYNLKKNNICVIPLYTYRSFSSY